MGERLVLTESSARVVRSPKVGGESGFTEPGGLPSTARVSVNTTGRVLAGESGFIEPVASRPRRLSSSSLGPGTGG